MSVCLYLSTRCFSRIHSIDTKLLRIIKCVRVKVRRKFGDDRRSVRERRGTNMGTCTHICVYVRNSESSGEMTSAGRAHHFRAKVQGWAHVEIIALPSVVLLCSETFLIVDVVVVDITSLLTSPKMKIQSERRQWSRERSVPIATAFIFSDFSDRKYAHIVVQ